MKKLLIVLALIVGFGVSAQDTKIINLKVNTNGENIKIAWNTKRAPIVNYKKEGYNTWQKANKPNRGEPYRIYINKRKNTDDRTYIIRAKRHHRVGLDGILKDDRKIRILKIHEIKINDASYIQLKVKGDLKELKGKTVYAGNSNRKGKVRNFSYTFNGITTIYIDYTDNEVKAVADEDLNYIWFKQSI